MKTLANCKPSEFLKQTNRIRKSVSKWLDLTGIQDIRRRLPEMPYDADERERKRLIQEQALKNANEILNIILDEHPDETLELLALLCFVEPKDVDNYSVGEYLRCYKELISDEDVIGFFISLINLDRISI